MAEKITIKGVIVFNNNSREYQFTHFLDKSSFTDGVFKNDYSDYVFICEHIIEVDVPEIDLITLQLNSLERELEKEVDRHRRVVRRIEVEKNNLLAIPMESK